MTEEDLERVVNVLRRCHKKKIDVGYRMVYYL